MGMMRKMALMKAMSSEEDMPQEAYETSEKKETYSMPNDGSIEDWRKNQKRKKMLLDKGQGKYAAPMRYALRQGTKKVKEKIKDVVSDIKETGSRIRTKKDAAGPTSRNKSVQVCTSGGKCQN